MDKKCKLWSINGNVRLRLENYTYTPFKQMAALNATGKLFFGSLAPS